MRDPAGQQPGLCVGTVLVWLPQFSFFLLPNNDYASFEHVARAFARGELPQVYQRMPLFPAAMALLAPLLPGPQAFLHAALALNLAFSVGSLVLLHRLGARTLGRGALVPPALLAGSGQFHAAALQPLVEPSLGFCVIAAFAALAARSRWQWPAAFGAALSRYEVAVLIPVLVLANLAATRRWREPLVSGALASTGLLAWVALGATHGGGTGTGTYLHLMSGMDFTPEPDFVLRSLKEPFRGWYRDQGPGIALFAGTVGAPALAGVLHGLRRFRTETAAMLLFAGLCVATIVLFGIAKPRYVYPTQWILLFFFAAGCLALARRGAAEAARRLPHRVVQAAAVGAAAVAAALAARALRDVAGAYHVAWGALDVAHVALCLGVAAGGLAWRGAAARAASCALLALWVPLLAGGADGWSRDAFKIRHANYGTWLAARYVERELPPGVGVVIFGADHLLRLTQLDPERVATFAGLGAEDPAELAGRMRERGLTHVIYTWRGPVRNPSDAYYREALDVELAEAFQRGAPVPGFEHVATLEIPEEIDEGPAQVYRLVGGEPAKGPAAATR